MGSDDELLVGEERRPFRVEQEIDDNMVRWGYEPWARTLNSRLFWDLRQVTHCSTR